jgi:hypothetical protein
VSVATFIATTKVVVRFGTVQGVTPPLGEAIASHWWQCLSPPMQGSSFTLEGSNARHTGVVVVRAADMAVNSVASGDLA